MDLIIWRHAQVELDSRPDLERILSAEGHANAAHAARNLRPHLPADCKILVSPALRAIQTAQALKLPFEIVEELAPRTSVKRILQALNWPEFSQSQQSVLIVGHQPSLGMLMSYLQIGREREFEIQNAIAFWLIDTNENGQRGYRLKGAFGPGGMSWRKEKKP